MTSCTRKTSNVASYIRFTDFQYVYIDFSVLGVNITLPYSWRIKLGF
jgi:hypothetical protein